MQYQYSATPERGLGTVHNDDRSTAGATRWRGRCICGRRTHMVYSKATFAINAIRSVHNADVPEEHCP